MRSCTYCGRGGHNRRSCPALKKTIRDDPEGYYARVEDRKRRQESLANAHTVERKATPSVLVKICREIAKFKQDEQRNGEGSFLVAVKILALALARW